jgi:hypothetical protein
MDTEQGSMFTVHQITVMQNHHTQTNTSSVVFGEAMVPPRDTSKPCLALLTELRQERARRQTYQVLEVLEELHEEEVEHSNGQLKVVGLKSSWSGTKGREQGVSHHHSDELPG